MRKSGWKSLLLLGLIAGLGQTTVASTARADFNIATGLKWVPLRYTGPVGAGGDAEAHTIPVPGQRYGGTGGSLYGWQTTSLDNYIAFFFTEQVGIQLSLDLGWGSHNNDTTVPNNAFNLNTSYFQFGVGLGGKFYLNRPIAQRVSPYILVNFFKYFASVSTNTQTMPEDVSAIAAFHSPIGFDLAFGAEYFFTTSFSIGAEVLGLRFAHVGADYNPVTPQNQAIGRAILSENYFTLYTGISLNYRFLATASVRTYEEEEDRTSPRAPVRRKRRPPPPPVDDGSGDQPPPPQPSPESVD